MYITLLLIFSVVNFRQPENLSGSFFFFLSLFFITPRPHGEEDMFSLKVCKSKEIAVGAFSHSNDISACNMEWNKYSVKRGSKRRAVCGSSCRKREVVNQVLGQAFGRKF
jgi:hypothetical protein